MAPCVRFSLLGKAVPRLIGFCPVCVSWQKRSVTAPFGHRLSDELSEIILDYLHFDHRLTTTVQWHYKMLEKPVVTTNNGLFLVLGRNCAESTKFTFQRQSILPCRSSPTRKARGSNPPGRTKSSTLWGAALFVLHGFYGAVKERIRTARAPRFASRGAETSRWGVSRAWLGESLRAHQTMKIRTFSR